MNCINEHAFDPSEFYMEYPSKVINRIGYPARAVFKSTWMWLLYGETIIKEIDTIDTYADIGGCFGFSANAMAFYIAKRQGTCPMTYVFEISSAFIEIGQMLFPRIEFINADISKVDDGLGIFDLITLFDVVEHLRDPLEFLNSIASRSRYLMIKTPMETSGEWRGNHPPEKQGAAHEDGHINFYTPKTYERLLRDSDLEIISSQVIRTIVPNGGEIYLCPEHYDFKVSRFPMLLGKNVSYSVIRPGIVNPMKNPKQFLSIILRRLPVLSWRFKRRLFGGGDYVSLCRSRKTC
jgi:SAM-dependent methyltransferase